MSDQALAWKLAFGALVLVFCAVAFLARKDARPAATLAASAPAHPAPAPAPAPPPLPSASGPTPSQEPAPIDLPDAQEAPVRIHISLADPPPRAKRPAAAKAHRAAKHVAAAKPRAVHASHRQPGRARQASPYAIGRQHYPFDPRDRWRAHES